MTTSTAAASSDKLFQTLKGNPAAINKLASDYENVAKDLTTSQKRLREASDDLKNLKGKNFDALEAHAGRLLEQYGHLVKHLTTLAEELHAYAKQLSNAQSAAEAARTRYLNAVGNLNDAFSGAPVPVPTELLHPATYPDAPVDTAGWPMAAMSVANVLDSARVDWHAAAKLKDRAGDSAHDKIDSSALLQAMGFQTADAKGGHVSKIKDAVAATGAAAAVAVGAKAARRNSARADYRAAAAAIKKQFAPQREQLTTQLAAAKKTGDTASAKRIQDRLDLVDDREKLRLSEAKENRDNRLDRINDKVDAKEERSEAHADAKEQKELSDREHQLDQQAAHDELVKAQASGDPNAIAAAKQHAQLIDDRHAFQQQEADAHLHSRLEHINLAEHPGEHPAQAAHQLLQHDKQLANHNYQERQSLENRSYHLQHSTLEHRIETAKAGGDADLASKLQAHDKELSSAHEQHLAQLKQSHAERIDILQKTFDTAHPHYGHTGQGESLHAEVGIEKVGGAHGAAFVAEAKPLPAEAHFAGAEVSPAAHGVEHLVQPAAHGVEHLATPVESAGQGEAHSVAASVRPAAHGAEHLAVAPVESVGHGEAHFVAAPVQPAAHGVEHLAAAPVQPAAHGEAFVADANPLQGEAHLADVPVEAEIKPAEAGEWQLFATQPPVQQSNMTIGDEKS